jgi:hypothetical protein
MLNQAIHVLDSAAWEPAHAETEVRKLSSPMTLSHQKTLIKTMKALAKMICLNLAKENRTALAETMKTRATRT